MCFSVSRLLFGAAWQPRVSGASGPDQDVDVQIAQGSCIVFPLRTKVKTETRSLEIW